jgi:hypothetical protein
MLSHVWRRIELNTIINLKIKKKKKKRLDNFEENKNKTIILIQTILKILSFFQTEFDDVVVSFLLLTD